MEIVEVNSNVVLAIWVSCTPVRKGSCMRCEDRQINTDENFAIVLRHG
jgi:hypothetical protein